MITLLYARLKPGLCRFDSIILYLLNSTSRSSLLCKPPLRSGRQAARSHPSHHLATRCAQVLDSPVLLQHSGQLARRKNTRALSTGLEGGVGSERRVQ